MNELGGLAWKIVRKLFHQNYLLNEIAKGWNQNLQRQRLTFDAISTKLNTLGYRKRYDKEFSKSAVKIIFDRYSMDSV